MNNTSITGNMQKLRVLAIDDDAAVLFLLKMTLMHVDAAAEFATANNGQVGLKLIKESSSARLPDFILLDLNMPVMDGWDFLKGLETLNPQPEKRIPVYILSSSIRESDVTRAKENKLVNGYISKPLNEEMLKQIINAVGNKTDSFVNL